MVGLGVLKLDGMRPIRGKISDGRPHVELEHAVPPEGGRRKVRFFLYLLFIYLFLQRPCRVCMETNNGLSSCKHRVYMLPQILLERQRDAL